MPRYQVKIVEIDMFAWYSRLEDTIEFQTLEAAEAFQKHYNTQNNEGEIEGNILVAKKPVEITEETHDKV